MLLKTVLVAVALAAPAFAYEEVTCTKNATQNIITSINPETNSFCTMMTGYGVYPVAPNEGCASVYCYGEKSKLAPPMPAGYILSTNFQVTPNFTQVTGCIDSSVWAQNPIDDGGQMDSHGWPYSCEGFGKFVSLIEPATNSFCLRCCKDNNNIDCNTSISTKGCWNVVAGVYSMGDGAVCKPPAGSTVTNPVATTASNVAPSTTSPGSTTAPTVSVGVGAGSGLTGSTGSTGSTGPSGSTGSTVKTNAGSRSSASFEVVGAVTALALAIAASF